MEFGLNNNVNNFYEDADDCYLRRLSLYATLRPEDLTALKTNSSRSNLSLTRFNTAVQSLQDLFSDSRGPRNYIPGLQTALVEKDEQAHTSSSESLGHEEDITVNGKDIGDLPIEYRVEGLRGHELPVKGFYLDERIAPGFRYRVRYVGTNTHVADGEARVLQSIGMGYGKRLTFQGDSLNHNEEYFWSDSHPDGFAFSICAVSNGDRFSVYDSMSAVVGEVVIVNTDSAQMETKTECKHGQVKKYVHVHATCRVNLFHRHPSYLIDMEDNQKLHVIDGVAEVVKTKGSRRASTMKIADISLPRVGSCSLWKEE